MPVQKYYIYLLYQNQTTMNCSVIRNLKGTDRKVTKFLFIPRFVRGKVKWLSFVTIHEDYIDDEWVEISVR